MSGIVPTLSAGNSLSVVLADQLAWATRRVSYNSAPFELACLAVLQAAAGASSVPQALSLAGNAVAAASNLDGALEGYGSLSAVLGTPFPSNVYAS